jgi:hypothetical protein
VSCGCKRRGDGCIELIEHLLDKIYSEPLLQAAYVMDVPACLGDCVVSRPPNHISARPGHQGTARKNGKWVFSIFLWIVRCPGETALL